jgi:hypothetical protein
MTFIFTNTVTYASKRVDVRDNDHKIIGTAWIPHDYNASNFCSLIYLVLSSLQLWIVLELVSLSKAKNTAEQGAAANP